MGIEDIDFLKKNSIKENYIFTVDSKERNKLAYKDPSEYVVSFESPFKNVIGLNLIDASIPRTMYNIDVYNNQIRFFIYTNALDINELSFSDFVSVTLTTGDYTIQTLVVELSSKLRMRLNNDSYEPIVGITVSPITNPPDIQSRIQFNCPYAFILDMKNSTIAETLGFDAFVRPAEVSKPIELRNYDIFLPDLFASDVFEDSLKQAYGLVLAGETVESIIAWFERTYTHIEAVTLTNLIYQYKDNYQLFHSVYIPFNDLRAKTSAFANNTYPLFEGPKGVIRTLSLNEQTVAQRFVVSYNTNLVKIHAALETSELSNASIATFSIQDDYSGVPSGIALISGGIAVSFVDGSYSDSIDLTYKFVKNTYYWVVFDRPTTNINIYYNDVLIADKSLQIKKADLWEKIDDIANTIYYQLALRIDVCDEYYSIKSPGIYSLIGERYIILRCKEIEENSYRSLAYTKYVMGIAKFTMGVVGYKEERLDYSSVPAREFHPIGKLSRMTLRFETQKGQLYDFKDVNHTLTFAIKYLEPTGNAEFVKSVINANYNGDFMKYQYTQEEQEEDSDDQDIDYNRDDFEKYKANESRNMPIQVAQRNLQTFYDLNYEDQNDEY